MLFYTWFTTFKFLFHSRSEPLYYQQILLKIPVPPKQCAHVSVGQELTQRQHVDSLDFKEGHCGAGLTVSLASNLDCSLRNPNAGAQKHLYLSVTGQVDNWGQVSVVSAVTESCLLSMSAQTFMSLSSLGASCHLIFFQLIYLCLIQSASYNTDN